MNINILSNVYNDLKITPLPVKDFPYNKNYSYKIVVKYLGEDIFTGKTLKCFDERLIQTKFIFFHKEIARCYSTEHHNSHIKVWKEKYKITDKNIKYI